MLLHTFICVYVLTKQIKLCSDSMAHFPPDGTVLEGDLASGFIMPFDWSSVTRRHLLTVVLIMIIRRH